jgi:hypothetical protein
MNFFNPKEEVLDIQLTQYGRRLLAKGDWKPTYYAFFDENVLYDSQYGGPTENKNQAESRIQDETPLLKTQYSFTGRDEYLFDGQDDQTDRIRLDSYEKLTTMPMSLGTTALDSTKTPAFKIQFLEGEINDLQARMTGNIRNTRVPVSTTTTYSQQLLRIPQIESDIEFQVTVVDPANPQVKFEIDPTLTPGGSYLDGTSVVIGPEQILLVIEEKNSTFSYKNFDIEVFEMTNESGALGEQVMNQLSFIKPLEMVENNLLIDKKEAELKAGRVNGQLPALDDTYVEYYFNINVDEEIDKNSICKSISELKSKNILIDAEFDCPDILTPIRANIYASDAADEECPDN